MLSISNGLLPDLGENIGENREEPIVSFSYDNTLEEIDGAMKTYQQHFRSRRNTFAMIAYSLLTAAVVVAIVLDPKNILAYGALIFCAWGLYYSLTDKKRTRRKTIDALKDMNPEDYRASFYENRVEIETLVREKTNEVALKIDEDADEEIISPLKNVFRYADDVLEFFENDESLLLVYNKHQIYCFPRRCMTTEQENEIQKLLTDRLGR